MANYRKGYSIHFIKRDAIEKITKTVKPSCPINGMITTDANEYSVDFLNRWHSFGFIKILKK
jgi:hypothetical protein